MKVIVSVLLTSALMFGLLWQRTHGFQVFTYESNRQVSVAKANPHLSDWSLQLGEGPVVSLSHWANKTLLVDFIYTRCPTVCRALGSKYAQLQKELARQNRSDVHLLSISIDPEYDSAEKLLEYRTRHGGNSSNWSVARPVSAMVASQIIKETGLRVIPDDFGGFSHSESLHWIQGRRLTHIEDWRALNIPITQEVDHSP